MKTAPFAEDAGPFLPTTPLSDEEASRLYRRHKRQTTGVTDYVGSQLDKLDEGLTKQLRTSEQLKRNKELGEKFTPVELALGGAGPPSKEAVKEAAGYAGEAAKFAVGDTPAEWAAGALMGPGKLPGKLARAAVLSSLHTPEAEGVLLNLNARSPSRWDIMRRTAEKLKGQGRSAADIFHETGGTITVGPDGTLEAIYRPQSWNISNLTRTKKPLLDVFRDKRLGQDVPELKDFSIRRSLPGELEAGTYGQFKPKESLVLVNQNVKDLDFLRGAVGHETGHAVSQATGDLSRLGTGGAFKTKQLDEALQDLQKYTPGLLDPDERAKHMALAWRLRLAKEKEPMDLYFRDIGEAHGRASESAARIPGLEPYANPIVTKRFGMQRPVYDDNPFARSMNPSSVVESGDVADIVRKLKQTVGAP